MTPKEFFYKVVDMRKAQKNYQDTRHYSYLDEVNQYEKEIDNEIKRVNATLAQRNNPKLDL